MLGFRGSGVDGLMRGAGGGVGGHVKTGGGERERKTRRLVLPEQ